MRLTAASFFKNIKKVLKFKKCIKNFKNIEKTILLYKNAIKY